MMGVMTSSKVRSGILILLLLAILSINSPVEIKTFSDQKEENLLQEQTPMKYYHKISRTNLIERTSDHIDIEASIIKINNTNSLIIEDQPGAVINNQNLINQSIYIINSPNTIIRSNSIVNISSSDYNVGIQIINSSNTVIEENTISNLHSTNNSSIGIEIHDSDNVVIRQNQLESLTTEMTVNSQDQLGSVGVFVNSSKNVTILSNTIESITSILPFGIFTKNSEYLSINENRISNLFATGSRVEGAGIVCDNIFFGTLLGNYISNIDSEGDILSTSFGVTVTNSKFIRIENNNINLISTHSDDPNAFGIHAVTNTTYIWILDNRISKIESSTTNLAESYSTGIYLADMSNGILKNNLIQQIQNFGSAAYGLFLDVTHKITSISNDIEDVYSSSDEATQAVGITARSSPLFETRGDNITNISTQIHHVGDTAYTLSAIGIIIDYSDNSVISGSSINNLSGTSGSNIVDAIGIILHKSSDTQVNNNRIDNLYSHSDDNALTMGFTISSSFNVELDGNNVSELHSTGDIFGLYYSNLQNSSIINNKIRKLFAAHTVYGQYIFLCKRLKFSNNTINDLFHSSRSIGFQLSSSVNISIISSLIKDNQYEKSSTGFYLTGGENIHITTNTVENKELWIKLLNEEIQVDCSNNEINGVNISTCDNLGFEPYTSSKLEDTIDTSVHDSTPNANEFNLLPVIIGASIIVTIVVIIARKYNMYLNI